MFNTGWKFRKINEDTKLYRMDIDTSDWEEVTLPHTWNAVDGCDSYYRGLGAYIKEYLFPSQAYAGKKVYLEFEGANTVTTVYINGVKAGEPHRGGYAGFRYDITELIWLDKKNTILVTVDNFLTTDIAPLKLEGDFTKFGGIYRKVSLTTTDLIYIDRMDYGSEGIYITNSNVTAKSADTNVKVRVTNDSGKSRLVTITVKITDHEGATVAAAELETTVLSGGTKEATLELSVSNPHLWQGIKNPYLYTVHVHLSDGKYYDEKLIRIGYRSFTVNNSGLLLNGVKYPVFGVNYHQDSDENGWGMSNEQRVRDYAIMKDMGVTAVRMAHYQHAPYEYEICDREGFPVWTEIPFINRSTIGDEKEPSAEFGRNIKQQLIEMIRQNYNHPSVFFWGISNELSDTGEGTKKLYQELCSLAREEDPSRITIYADNYATDEVRKRSHTAEAVGYNRYDGWYYSSLGKMHTWVGEKMAADPRPSCISEYGAGAAVTQHMENPAMEDIVPNGTPHYEEYQAIYHEAAWADICSMEKLWGSFIWCMFDFASYSRSEGDTQGQNDKGLITRDRKVYKDAYYFYRSLWNPNPMVYITGRRYTERKTPVPEVKIYSNAVSAELFINGRSFGKLLRADLNEEAKTIFRWKDITLETGSNEVKVLAAWQDGTTGEDMIKWNCRKQ